MIQPKNLRNQTGQSQVRQNLSDYQALVFPDNQEADLHNIKTTKNGSIFGNLKDAL